VKHVMNTATVKHLVTFLINFGGLLLMAPIIKAAFVYGNNHYPFATLSLLIILGTAFLLGSKRWRNEALHIIQQNTRLETLMLVEGEEARMLEDREKKTGETQSLEFWR
jgi:hypothetical protein